ncbi:MAG: hypothetical protein JSU91_03780 [Thermoplasmatales archaeon]|nr:MAG: hypothetical protein JSU91_03780 [Thermoplasmatales archaeon]
MKKILTLLIIGILILIGFRAIAIPHEKLTENKPLNLNPLQLEIVIEGGFLGYIISIINSGTERITGNITIEIITEAMVVVFGANLSNESSFNIDPLKGTFNFKLQPLIGFGSATCYISGVVQIDDIEYPFETVTNGYAFIIFLICDEKSIFIT